MLPFLTLRYPCPFVSSTKIQSLAGILQCTCLFSVRMLPFLVPLHPRPCVPSTKIQSLAGISCSARVCFQFGCYFLWCSITHAYASQAQRFSRWLVSCSARFLFLNSDVTFSGAPSPVFCVALYHCFLLSTLFDSKPTGTPTRGTLASISNHQSSIINHQSRGVGWSIASFAVVVLISSISDPLPDFLMY